MHLSLSHAHTQTQTKERTIKIEPKAVVQNTRCKATKRMKELGIADEKVRK